MALQTLKPRLQADQRNRVPVLLTKVGTTERVRGNAWMATRSRILLRDGYTCACCGLVRPDHQVDHRTPLEQGGSNRDENLQTLCIDCHAGKTRQEASQRAGRMV